MIMKVKDYKELKVWQQGIEIVDKIYSITDNFPKDELYGLSQSNEKVCIINSFKYF